MKIPRIVNVIGQIDEDIVSDTIVHENKKKNYWVRWGYIAACFIMFVIVGAIFIPALFDKDVKPVETNDRYKNYSIHEQDFAIVWPWEELTVYEKYTSLKFEGHEYNSHRRAISAEFVGDLLGTYSIIGYDLITDKQYSEDFEVYQLKYADKSQYVAAKMEGICYVFKNNEYNPPSTLGELFELVDLQNAIQLNRFHENDDSSKKDYALNDDEYVWDILSNLKNAAFVEDDKWFAKDREYLCFTVTSETLGVYKVAMYITSDGYLWTNAFNYQYLFNIGKDAADKITQYVWGNSTEVEYQPYQNAIVGEIVGITDEYILVNDSVLCKNPTDGISYKVMLNNQCISRYVEREIIKSGDIVQIIYEGDIDESNIITSAISASEVFISIGGDVLIPE